MWEKKRTINEDILRLDITMNDIIRVHKVNTAHNLIHDLLGLGLAETDFRSLDLLEQILLDELEDEIDAATATKDLDEIH